MSAWLKYLLRRYRDENGCLPAENDFCVEPSSEDGTPPNTPCIVCRLTDAVLADTHEALRWSGEEAGTLTAPVGRDAVAVLHDEGKAGSWRIEDDDGTVIGEGEDPTLAGALYRCEKVVYEQGVNA